MGGRDVLRRIMCSAALAAVIGWAASGGLAEAEPQKSAEPTPQSTVPASGAPPVTVAQSAGCVSDCQAQHDRCRVATKGSRSCDEERQRCLEICLQKKKK
jgi:hypothetical protein